MALKKSLNETNEQDTIDYIIRSNNLANLYMEEDSFRKAELFTGQHLF